MTIHIKLINVSLSQVRLFFIHLCLYSINHFLSIYYRKIYLLLFLIVHDNWTRVSLEQIIY